MKEERLIALYKELTGSSEGLARSVFMHVNSGNRQLSGGDNNSGTNGAGAANGQGAEKNTSFPE